MPKRSRRRAAWAARSNSQSSTPPAAPPALAAPAAQLATCRASVKPAAAVRTASARLMKTFAGVGS